MVWLSGCFSTIEVYDESWPVREPIESSKFHPCPTLVGSYVDIPTSGFRNTDSRFKDHVYLTYNLFSRARHSFRDRNYISRDVEQLIGQTVEIRQPSRDVLELIVWRGNGLGRVTLRHDVLFEKDGDFSCGPEGLALKTRTEFAIFFGGNFIVSVARTMSRATDGSLVMKITQTAVGTAALVIPLGGNIESWLRWAPAAEASAGNSE